MNYTPCLDLAFYHSVTPLYASEKAGHSALTLSVFSGLSLVLVSILLFHFKYKYVYPSSKQRSSLSSEHNSSSLETNTDLVIEKLRRKNAFLDLNKGYGYASSRRGHIDTWREHEFPGLISPISESTIRDGHCQTNDAERSDGIENDEKEVYLDYAGASLPSKSQLNALHLLSMKSQVLGNPHSIGPAASRTMSQIEHVKRRILELFDADVGSIHGHGIKTEEQYSTTEESKEQHPGYDIIFTSGATEALKIVAENFAWSSNSVFLYSKNVHTSVIGMRGPAMTHGATFQCKSQSEITNARSESFSSWAQNTFDLKEESKNSHSEKEKVNHLLAVPLESNFEGDRLNAQHIIKEARNSSRTIMSRQNQWYTLLDVAKAASTSPISLRELDPDYACLSFYKIFGAPTGIGCLFVKRNKCNTLLHPNNHSYFGGGSVDVVLTGQKFVFPRSSPSPLSSLVHGTINFRNIINLLPGLEEIGDLGGMRQIHFHTMSLAAEASRRLKDLVHLNGNRVVELYGNWGQKTDANEAKSGPTLAFNILRHDGSVVGYNEVAKLAALNLPPIQLRTGCFCNPGACQDAVQLSDNDIKNNFLKSGHICGDHIDVIDGKPTGAVRVSFGKESIWEDLDIILLFIQNMFVSGRQGFKIGSIKRSSDVSARLSEIHVFPIKSCGGMQVKQWKMHKITGKLLFDREFALVNSSGVALRLSTHPSLGFIRPIICFEDNRTILKVKALHSKMKDLEISLDENKYQDHETYPVKVCGNQCGGCVWGSNYVANWFSSVLNMRCWLVRYSQGHGQPKAPYNETRTLISGSRTGFENEAPLLLISQKSVDILNSTLKEKGNKIVCAQHFRPNLVVDSKISNLSLKKGGTENPEDNWNKVSFPRHHIVLSVMGQCARCSMVDIDPSNGTKGKTLRALSEYRRNQGKINFGIFLGSHDIDNSDEHVIINEGETLIVK